MKKNYFLLALLAIAITFGSCGKYEDGPNISLRTKKARVAGNWKVVKVTINGINPFEETYSSLYPTSCGNDLLFTSTTSRINFTWNFSKEETYTYNYSTQLVSLNNAATYTNCVLTYQTYSEPGSGLGQWAFANDKEELAITEGSETTNYKIIKLKNKEMHLRNTIDGEVTELYFEQD
jgi:hypothetical protein